MCVCSLLSDVSILEFIILTNCSRYDWSLNLSYFHHHTNCTNIDKYESSHITMIWGWRAGQEVPNITISAKFILGFNEPNHFKQSNLTAQEAATYWRILENGTRGLPLVSPAAAPCGSKSGCHGNTIEWFDKFFKECVGCRIDYLATHAYFCNADETMRFLKTLFDRYGKKIWLTEFACPYTKSVQRQLKLMSEILPRLEASSYVFRYSWCASRIVTDGFVTTSGSLLEANSSTLTQLGRYYMTFQGPEQGRLCYHIILVVENSKVSPQSWGLMFMFLHVSAT